MTNVGGGFVRVETVPASSFVTLFAPSDETQKITMVYGKEGGATPRNKSLVVSPASGIETDEKQGTGSQDDEVPPLGGNASAAGTEIFGLQPVVITDSNGLYIGNKASSKEVIINGVRIA
jgi:hypothetical protein